jgi:hypothetical protein
MKSNEAYEIIKRNPDVSLKINDAVFINSTHQVAECSMSCILYNASINKKRITHQMISAKDLMIEIINKLDLK